MRREAASWVKNSAPAPLRDAVGRALRLRHRGKSDHEVWEAELAHEVEHWRRFFQEERAQTSWRANPTAPVPPDSRLFPLLEELEQDVVEILDVGAGPLTSVGRTHPGHTLRITAVDALAEAYDIALAEAGIEPPVRTIHAEGERLVEQFGADRFDVSCCTNALDHCYDPVKVIEQMVAVTRPGGTVLLEHGRNEAQHQLYRGLHQWNLDCRDGSLVVWNLDSSIDVHEHLAGQATCRTWLEGEGVVSHIRP